MRRPPLKSVGRTTLSVTRKQAGTGSYVNGEWVTSAVTTSVPVVANVQPALPAQLLIFPEADRSKKAITLWSYDEVRELKEGQWEADTFVWDGDQYEIVKVERWSMGVLDHYEAVAFRKLLTPN